MIIDIHHLDVEVMDATAQGVLDAACALTFDLFL
jgi:hypothetical protein